MTDSFDLRRFVNAQAPLRGDVKKGRQEAVITTNFPIAIRVTAATRLALECAAAIAGSREPDSLRASWRGRWPFSTQRFRTDGKTIFLEITERDHDGRMIDLKKRQQVFRTSPVPSHAGHSTSVLTSFRFFDLFIKFLC
jgi:hypothetical protein